MLWSIVAWVAGVLSAPPVEVGITVRGHHPHDPEAFTQGLVIHQGRLFESTGLYGSSTLREVDLQTGRVLRSVTLPSENFGEGLAVVPNIHGGPGHHLIQLTWREQVARVVTVDTFELVTTLSYEGEGWGLCFDGRDLVMSNGTSTLTFRDPATMAIRRHLSVTLDGSPLARLNELECVDGAVIANVWMTDFIVRIDAQTGEVTHRVHASGLLSPQEAARADVLNGIAHDPEHDRFYITGKLWPRLYEVALQGSPVVVEQSCTTAEKTSALSALWVAIGLIGRRVSRREKIACL